MTHRWFSCDSSLRRIFLLILLLEESWGYVVAEILDVRKREQ
jgi:hypothetical protein